MSNESEPMRAIRRRLEALMAPESVGSFLSGVMSEAGITTLESAEDQLAVAEVLVRRRGVFGILGRSLKIDALLSGAVGMPASVRNAR